MPEFQAMDTNILFALAEDYYANDYPEDEDEDEDWVGSNHDKDSSFGSQDDQW